jgi:RND family efflux transporter MFP subunit
MHTMTRHLACAGLLFALPILAQNGPPPAAPVSVAPVVEAEIAGQRHLIGRVQAVRSSTVAAEVAGIVNKLYVDTGDVIAEGKPLVGQDTVLTALDAEAATAAFASAQAAWHESSNTLARTRVLHEKHQISEADFDAVRFNEDALRSRMHEARARQRHADTRVKRSTTHMPFNGTVTRKHVELGEWLPEGGPIVDVIDISTVDVMLDLPEAQIMDVDRSADVQIFIDGRTNAFTGKVAAIIPRADMQSHTVPLKIAVSNPDGILVDGMFVRAIVPTADQHKALLVPKDAISRQGTRASVYAVINGKAAPISIQTGAAQADHVVVLGELTVGQHVVVRGNERLRPGMDVEVTETIETFHRP